jgi:putative PEP-CTERM system histidine kinase
MVFFVGAIIVLISLLFSSHIRARLRVLLSKHFFHNKYDYREEWLRLVSTLAHFDKDAAPNVAIRAIAQIVNSPTGAMWVRGSDCPEFQLTARFGTEDEFPEIRQDAELIRFIEREGWVIDFVEYTSHPERYGGLSLPAWLHERNAAWLIVPLQSAGELLGVILLNKAVGSLRLNYEDRDLLKTVGNHIAVHLAQARSDAMLAEAQQFETFNRLTAFLMHDLNNLIAQQSLIVANAEKHKRNPEFIDDAIGTIAGSVKRMKRVMRQINRGGSEHAIKPTELKFIVSAAIDRCDIKHPTPTLETNGVDASICVNAEEFTMVLSHLIGNAQDACEKDGFVKVSICQSDGYATVTIVDNGTGMTTEFVRDRLFKPFDSTKGNQGMGIGAYQAREFARKMSGELNVTSSPEEGTTVSMRIPIANYSNTLDPMPQPSVRSVTVS